MKRFSGWTAFFYSIRFRLVVWFTAILALVMFAFSAFIYYNQARDIRGDATYRLERKLTEIEAALLGASDGSVRLQESDVFVLVGSSGIVLTSQGVASAQEALTLVTSASSVRQQDSDGHDEPLSSWIDPGVGGDSPYIFIVKAVPLGKQTGLAILGSPFDPYGLNNRLLFSLTLGNILTVLVALLGGLWLADRAMRPVRTITEAALSISETDLNKRLNMKSKDELGQLANTFDGMLARLQIAFERQRQFVADASHELRTPLTIVNLESSRALASKRSIPEYQRALGIIQSENQFMSHLVNDLLTLARMDAGQMVMEKNPLDLSDLALEALERLVPLAERKNVRLETGDLPELIILGDRQYLLQMLSNLIENGIKYTTGDEKRVRIETGQAESLAWVRVSDSGQGIAPEHLAHLFDRFYRVDKARSRDEAENQGGIGLGLSIVDWIARAHEAQVYVESTPGVGTTFEVRFKVAS